MTKSQAGPTPTPVLSAIRLRSINVHKEKWLGLPDRIRLGRLVGEGQVADEYMSWTREDRRSAKHGLVLHLGTIQTTTKTETSSWKWGRRVDAQETKKRQFPLHNNNITEGDEGENRKVKVEVQFVENRKWLGIKMWRK
ncbi:hypothetical protein DFH08DRAFT_804182 [Mycena albidolilacea]|uniref:Uncharacterized protein n=1 Tax=Mycena albidolilacea TaxID=1033008 RepID=A0AAD7ABL3_9AGAR|nr:hypothetical protein DFH08DRAFT_804182 [Mycena albidolilacea]